MTIPPPASDPGNLSSEWLETDGLGGFASGTLAGVRTRRYHALLLSAATPPTDRFVLVNGLEAWLETSGGTVPLSSQAYAPDVIHPDGARRIESFQGEPWPRWTFRLPDGARVEQEIFVPAGIPAAAVSWRLRDARPDVFLSVRPLLSGRDLHALHHENPAFRFDAEVADGRVAWHPYDGVPGIRALFNGSYQHRPVWYRNFLYGAERARGLDFLEDLASPGVFRWELSRGEAVWILAADLPQAAPALRGASVPGLLKWMRERERRRRRRFPSRLHRAADDYIVRRGNGKTIVAGYPWFADWGRDTFVAVRGLCLATGRLDDAREILLEWTGAVSEGMLPSRFPDRGEEPEYNSVDASLWYVIAVHDYLEASRARKKRVPPGDREAFRETIEAVLEGYSRGTRYGIRADDDGLLAAGVPGVPLTWMDAKVGDWVVTPRIGKPVEVQALWLNALRIGAGVSARRDERLARGLEAFRARFWNEELGYLHDVVDPDHRPGTADATFRPNQIFAVAGLPMSLLDPDRARRVVDAIEARLLAPLGLRSLAPGEPGYAPRYEGGIRERDGAYHQGTVWPWLLGPFVEAWVRVRGGDPAVKREARTRFLQPLLRHLDDAGLGHISEIADAEPPHIPRGCPFQAWSVGEALRLVEGLLADETLRPRPRRRLSGSVSPGGGTR